jgi:hypothetical protein
MTERDELTEQELEAHEASQLPDREVMSLITTPTPGITPDGGLPDYQTDATSGGASTGTDAAHGATTSLGSAAGSVSEGDAAPTDADVHETFTSTDTASAES